MAHQIFMSHFCRVHQEPETVAESYEVVCKLCKTKKKTNLKQYTYCKSCALFKEKCSQCGNSTTQVRSPTRGSPRGMKADISAGVFILPLNLSEIPKHTVKDYCCKKHQKQTTAYFTAPHDIECPHCLTPKRTYLRHMWHCDECAMILRKCSVCWEDI